MSWDAGSWGRRNPPEAPKPEEKPPRYGLPKSKLRIGLFLYRYNSNTESVDTFTIQEWAHQGDSYAVFVRSKRFFMLKGWYTEQELKAAGFSYYHAVIAEDHCPSELFGVTEWNKPILLEHLKVCSDLPLSFGGAGNA